VAKRYVLDVKDKEVDGAFNGMARRAGSTPKQFADALTQAGISVEALKQRIKADIGWQAIIRGKFQGQLQVGEKDVLTALASRKKDDKPDLSYDYTLRQVMFIVPRGSPPSAAEARLHEAEALRARFQSCDEGLPMARALRDVAVREPMRRSSADLPAQQRQILDGTAAGRLTPPEITLQGVETFAVCSKAQAGGDDTPGRREVREEITTERYNAQAKRFLRELRRGAMIELR